MKYKPYNPVNMDDQHEKNRIRAQMEADHYWKKQIEQQDAARLEEKPFRPLAFKWRISFYARRRHSLPSSAVGMSSYYKHLLKQAGNVSAQITHIKEDYRD